MNLWIVCLLWWNYYLVTVWRVVFVVSQELPFCRLMELAWCWLFKFQTKNSLTQESGCWTKGNAFHLGMPLLYKSNFFYVGKRKKKKEKIWFMSTFYASDTGWLNYNLFIETNAFHPVWDNELDIYITMGWW